jgi:hypothetical protein
MSLDLLHKLGDTFQQGRREDRIISPMSLLKDFEDLLTLDVRSVFATETCIGLEVRRPQVHGFGPPPPLRQAARMNEL